MLLTIGITTFNNEHTIIELLESIVNSSKSVCDNFCIYIYDDKSTDRTIEIIGEFKKNNKDINIKLEVGEVNTKTPSTGRNFIFENAKSDYVFFFDGDDIFLGDIKELINIINSNDKKMYPVITTQIKRVVNGELKNTALPYHRKTFETCYPYCAAFQATINHIYSLDFINEYNLRYDNTRYEDVIFNFKVLAVNENPYVIPYVYYGWVYHENSFTRTIDKTHFEHRLNSIKTILDIIKNIDDKELVDYMYNYVVIVYIGNYIKGYFKIDKNNFKYYISNLYNIDDGFIKSIYNVRNVYGNRRIELIKKFLKMNKNISINSMFILNKCLYIKRKFIK